MLSSSRLCGASSTANEESGPGRLWTGSQRHAGAGNCPYPERRAEGRGVETAGGGPVATVDYAVGRTANNPCLALPSGEVDVQG